MSFICTAILLFSSCNNRDAASKTRMIKDTTSSNDEFSFDSVVVKDIFLGDGRFPDLHFIMNADSVMIFSDSIELSSKYELDAKLMLKKELLFDLLKSEFSRKPFIHKKYRKPDGGCEGPIFNFKFYNNESLVLDTTIDYECDYPYFSDDMLLCIKSICSIQSYYLSGKMKTIIKKEKKHK